MIRAEIKGQHQNVLRCRLQNEAGIGIDAVYFGDVQECRRVIQENETMSFTYFPQINEYKGRRTIQLKIENYR